MPYADREAQRKYQAEWMARRRAAFFADKKCATCGAKERLHLHHLDKTKKVSHRIWSWAEERRAKEISKCEVLCERCHQEHHAEERHAALEHGVNIGLYSKGCRCQPCKDLNARIQREWKARRRSTPTP